MKILLDANAYSAFKRGHRAVMDLVHRSEKIYLSAIVTGELLFGFRHGLRFEQNLRELEVFLERPPVSFVPVTYVTADRFSRIAKALRDKGAPIPTNDIWIAAHAMEHGVDLISFDRHFAQIDGLAWTEPAS